MGGTGRNGAELLPVALFALHLRLPVTALARSAGA
jgi:hypothetical protein